MRKIEAGSYYSYLPEGCRICRKGAKLVLFVTGVCKSSCFYCPVSREKIGKDVVYANERIVRSAGDFLEELRLMDAEGIAITGGEPLLRLDRVVEFLKMSKKLGLHTHIYTSIAADEKMLRKLEGLDEIRFHPPELKNPEKYENSIRIAKKLGMDAGFEIPAVCYRQEIVDIVNKLDAFLNVNQVEASETNWQNLVSRGFRIEDYYIDTPDIVREYERAEKFHYCSARFKDVAQFRRRLIRMAMNHPSFYQITMEGTLICCRIEGELDRAERLLKKLGYEYVRLENCIETSPQLVDEIGEFLKSEGFRLSIVERYPTSNRTVLEVMKV